MAEDIISGKIKEQGLLPLFYHADKQVCIDVTRALYRAGIRLLEFTNRGEAAMENFRALVELRNKEMKDLLLAVGTIRTAEQATNYMEGGADFLVSPVFDTSVCDAAYMQKILWIPGCMTPTEIHNAEGAGCRLVKLFPGNVLGPGFVSAIRELFPALELMPTGGVELDKNNLRAWFDAGVVAVGMGSKLISRELLAAKDYKTIEKNTKEALHLIVSVRKA
jgi:2-dehydro-3-deoxyphosphogluconate aldolase/(4S)-4-hydroxy-2-oxoglutarate aldolase